METGTDRFDALLRSGARRLTGHQRRLFMAEVATELCAANARQAEVRFGWGRQTVAKGLNEARLGIRCLENFRGAVGDVAKRRTRNWPRTFARSWNCIRKPTRN